MFLRLQVDLESPKKITGIITQGAKDFGTVQFVTAFKVAHSDDGQTWTIVKDATTRTDKVRSENKNRVVCLWCLHLLGYVTTMCPQPNDVITVIYCICVHILQIIPVLNLNT